MKWTGTDWLVFLGALAYALSPIDLLPDFFFPVGGLDDLAVIGWAVMHFTNKRAKANGAPEIKLHPVAKEEAIDAEFEIKEAS